jgi:hypothetical protein
MRNKVKNKLSMYRAVRQVIQKHNSSWTGLTAFESGVTKFLDKVTELENLSYQKAKALMGAKSHRDKQRAITADLTLKVSNALFAYASTIGDEILKAKVHYAPSTLKYTPNSRFLQLVEGLIATANELVTDITPYGVDQNKVDALEIAYLELVEIANLPRQAIVSRKVISEKIDNAISEVDTVLKDQLDRLVVLLKDDELDFVLTYEGARTILDHPATRRKLNLDDSTEEAQDDVFPEDQDDGSPPGGGV